MKLLPIFLLGLIAGCGAAPQPAVVRPASAPVANGATGAGPRAAGEEDAAVPIDARNPTWGSRTAPVTIVEFADFQCGFCRLAEPTLAKLRATYGPDFQSFMDGLISDASVPDQPGAGAATWRALVEAELPATRA